MHLSLPDQVGLAFEDPATCPTAGALDRPVDVVWGELANIAVGPDDIFLGRVGQIGCSSTAAGYRYHSRDPIPGKDLFYLAREVCEPSYGDGFDFRPRIATDGDCPLRSGRHESGAA